MKAENDARSTAEISALMERLRHGLHARDAAAVMALYAPDAVNFDLAPPLTDYPDEAGLAGWLHSWGGPVRRSMRDVHIAVSGDLAVCRNLTHMQTETDAGEAAAWWMRTTMVLERRVDGWRIVHEHNSVPFYMDGSDRAALDLKPEGVH